MSRTTRRYCHQIRDLHDYSSAYQRAQFTWSQPNCRVDQRLIRGNFGLTSTSEPHRNPGQDRWPSSEAPQDRPGTPPHRCHLGQFLPLPGRSPDRLRFPRDVTVTGRQAPVRAGGHRARHPPHPGPGRNRSPDRSLGHPGRQEPGHGPRGCRQQARFMIRDRDGKCRPVRRVAAEHQDSYAEYPARQQIGDLEQHPASQPSLRQACRR